MNQIESNGVKMPAKQNAGQMCAENIWKMDDGISRMYFAKFDCVHGIGKISKKHLPIYLVFTPLRF